MRVFAIRTSHEWVQIRASEEPPIEHKSTIKLEEEHREIVRDDNGNYSYIGGRIRTRQVKSVRDFTVTYWEGGKHLCNVPIGEMRKLTRKIPPAFAGSGLFMVELPPRTAAKFLSPTKRKEIPNAQ